MPNFYRFKPRINDAASYIGTHVELTAETRMIATPVAALAAGAKQIAPYVATACNWGSLVNAQAGATIGICVSWHKVAAHHQVVRGFPLSLCDVLQTYQLLGSLLPAPLTQFAGAGQEAESAGGNHTAMRGNTAGPRAN